MAKQEILSVYQLTKKLKTHVEEGSFSKLLVEGEISNFTHHNSGHMYFSLKDDKSRIKGVLFRSHASRLAFQPKNGQTCVAYGSVGVYESNGEYQLYVENLFPQGLGLLNQAFEKLKQKLKDEGLFCSSKKKPLPFLPQTIGVVTSQTGAALQDIISVVRRRNPKVRLILFPAIVQGVEAPASLCQALKQAQDYPIDVLIVGRGGGSIEELWAFNEEDVARGIAQCPIPLISAVGHETDFTIADFVADVRAETPSAAAMLATPDYYAFKQIIDEYRLRLDSSLRTMSRQKREKLEFLSTNKKLREPLLIVNEKRQRVDELLSRLEDTQKRVLERKQGRYATLVGKLDSLSPLATLKRGYAVCYGQNGEVVTSYQDVTEKESLCIRLSKGSLECLVEKRVEDE